ncbi:MAG: efflux RND transporter periplasmic adaptor subunit [Fusobacteriota bacterium]
MKKIITGIILAIIIFGVGGFYYYRYKNSDENKISEVIVKTPQKGEIASSVKTEGTIEIKNEEVIFLSKAQRVEKVYVDEGDEVKKGDLLISFDPEEKEEIRQNISKKKIEIENNKMNLEENQFEVSNMNILTKERELDKLETDRKKILENIRIAKIELENTKVEYENAKKDLEIKKQLFEVEGISIDEYNGAMQKKLNLESSVESKESQIRSLKIELEELSKNKELLEKEYQEAKRNYKENLLKQENNIQKIKNTIKVLDLEIRSLEKDLADTYEEIKSPVDGTIINVNAEDNFRVNMENSLMTIADINSQYINADITSYDIKNLKLGQKVKITSDSLDKNEYYTGNITKIDSIARKESGSGYTDTVIGIEIDFNSEKSKLKPGYDVDLEIIVDKKEDIMIIPSFAVISEARKKYVMVLESGNIVGKKEVETGISNDTQVEVLNLDESIKIIINGSNVKEGQIVKPVDRMTSDVPNSEGSGGFGGGGGGGRR